jgi:hypothetical protein
MTGTNHSHDRIRDALRAYMAAEGLKPTRWSLDAGLSGRALSHFLEGRSKSLSPDSLDKLARARRRTVTDLLGFSPPWMRGEEATGQAAGQAASAELGAVAAAVAASVAQVLAPLAEEMRALRERVERLERELEQSRTRAGGRKRPVK